MGLLLFGFLQGPALPKTRIDVVVPSSRAPKLVAEIRQSESTPDKP